MIKLIVRSHCSQEDVMINPATEDMLSIQQLCKLFPGRKGKGIARATAMRWILNGVGGVRLESVRIGGSRYTSREAVERFVAALNHCIPTKPVDRNREHQQVERTLATEGF